MMLVGHLTFELPYRRRQELEADTLGMELAARAGFDVTIAPALTRKLQKPQPQRFDRLMSLYPDRKMRVTNYKRLVRAHLGIMRKNRC